MEENRLKIVDFLAKIGKIRYFTDFSVSVLHAPVSASGRGKCRGFIDDKLNKSPINRGFIGDFSG